MIILKYKLCDFVTPDSNRGLLVDRDAMIDLLNSPETKRAVENRTLLGSLSHKTRDEFVARECKSVGSHADFLMTSPLTCNVLIDIGLGTDSRGQESVIGTLLVFDNDAGKTLQMLLSAGTKMQVSMSVYSKIKNNKWNFCRLNGVDMTCKGALSTELLDVVKGITYDDVN